MKKKTNNWKRGITLFLTGQTITMFGSMLVQFAIIWYITKITQSGLMITIATLCSFLPQVIISPIAGVWADRYNRKKIIIAADTLIAAATLALAVLMLFKIEIFSLIFVVSAVRSFGTGIQTPAVNAAIPQLVPQENLMKVNGYNASIQSFIMLVAPLAAGAILSFAPFYCILLIDVATAFLGIGLLLTIKLKNITLSESASYIAEIKNGAKYLTKNKLIGRLFLFYGLYSFLVVPSGFLSNLLVTNFFGDSYFFLSLNETIGAIGMLAGGLIIGIAGGFENRLKTFAVGILGYGALSILIGVSGQFWVYLIFLALMCFFMPFSNTAVMTLIQEKTEPEMQGRVFSFMQMIFSTLMPVGMILFGPLADAVSLRWLVIICGGLLIVVAAALFFSRSFYKQGIPLAQEKKCETTDSKKVYTDSDNEKAYTATAADIAASDTFDTMSNTALDVSAEEVAPVKNE